MATQTSLWFRDLNGNSDYAHIALKQVFGIIVPIYNDALNKNLSLEEFNESIVSFKVFFDTCSFELRDALITCKLTTDFDTGDVTTTADDTNLIIIQTNMHYVDHYFFPDDKTVTFAFLIICPGLEYDEDCGEDNTQVKPFVYSLNLESSNLTILYNKSTPETDFTCEIIPTGADVNVIHSSALTHNEARQIYNISFVRKDSVRGMYLFSINIQQRNNVYDILRVKVIEPAP